MSGPRCRAPPSLPDLLDYWFGDRGGAWEAGIEEHLFDCAECSARLARLPPLGQAVAQAVATGAVRSVLPAAFVRRLKEAGLAIREYRIQPGGSVHCTVAPHDDLVVAHLQAPLGDVDRLDLVLDAGEGGARRRVADVAFDPAAAGVVLASSVPELRRLGEVTQQVELVAVTHGEDRVLGRYTFNHSPWR
ncbi:MAG: hypothetical protein AB7G76_14305 [Steroidobacteraceae bacterium]